METIKIALQVPPPSQPEYAGKCYQRKEGATSVSMSHDEAMIEVARLLADDFTVTFEPPGVMYPNYICTREKCNEAQTRNP